MKPTVGRIVHYHSYGTPGGEFKPEPRAAIITAAKYSPGPRGQEKPIDDERAYVVEVCVFNPTGLFFNKVEFSVEPKPGCWSWPPRE